MLMGISIFILDSLDRGRKKLMDWNSSLEKRNYGNLKRELEGEENGFLIFKF